ncbi:hypothetical protein JCM30394_32390 [Deferrisoma palaeochoriense]
MAWAVPSGATHYPPGALCYDCHAVSASKMVAGTHLLKKSQKTFDLGITDTDPVVRCLFCHEENAVSVANRDRMKGVYHDFDATSLSKHPVDVTRSTFAQDATAFDCLDCHTVSGMTSDGAGNANIHGVDASQTLLDPATTLVGSPLNLSDAELSTKTCQSANCHDADGGAINGYNAPARHGASNAKITLNDVAVGENPVYCTRCHGKHASPDGERLLVLQNTSGHSGQPATNQTVRLTECDVCHTKDENGGLTDNYGLYGHGKVGVTCDTCHELRHDANGDRVFDPAPRLKATLAEDTAAGTSTFGTNFYSNCRHCHAGHAPHTPTPAAGGDAGTGRSAGCLDCHDQHGTAAADATFQNDTMIRRTVAGEDTQLPDDDVKYNGDWYLFGATNGTCDNTNCHNVIPAGQSLNDNGAGGTNHLGGTLTATTCASGNGCHDGHNSATTFGAAQACDACHGFPPTASDAHPDNADAVGVHDTHVNKMSYACSECHYNNNHNQSGWGSDQGTPVPSANVEVAFNPAFNPSGTYDTGTNTCSNLTCHNPDDSAIGITGKGDSTQTQRSAPVWLDAYKTTASTEATRNGYPANAGTWEIGDTGEECEACHLNSVISGYVQADGGSHWAHENPDAPQKNYPCRTCHAGENATANTYSPDHARGSLTDPALVAFDLTQAGIAGLGGEAFNNATSECTNIYCHGVSLGNGGTDQTPIWTDTTTGNCGTCHGSFGENTTTPAKEVNSHGHPRHYKDVWGPRLVSGHGGANCNSCHNSGDISNCAQCHIGSQLYGAINPGAVNISATHVNGSVEMTGGVSFAATAACDNCHSTASVNGQVGRDLAKTYWTTSNAIPCVNCHNGTDPATSLPDGTGRTAPDVLGDDASYGAEITGHNRPSGTYPASGNPAANKACGDCHDTASAHVNNADDTTFAGNRLRATVNTVSTGSTVSGLCGACHQTTLGTPATRQVSTHGNQNTSFTSGPTHDPNAEAFRYNCEACHEPHGMTRNANNTANIYMVRPSLEVKNHAVPTTGADRTTVIPVVFEAKSGPNSFDDGATQSNNMCVACHIDANRPGSSTALTNTDGNHIELDDYTSNEQGNDCSACHAHDYDSNAGGTADGFMPLQCDGCHGFPPATNAHSKHVTTAGYDCGKCHQNAGTHNETGVASATEFNNLMTTSPGTVRNNVDVVFDAGLNPNGAYSLAKGSRPNDTATYGTCNTLYCHGDDATRFPAADQGTDTTPEWNGTAACGTCHRATAAAPPGTFAHPTHAGSAAGYGFACATCHVSTTLDGTSVIYPSHANGQADVAFNAGDSRLDANSAYGGTVTVGDALSDPNDTCSGTYCHSPGNDTAAPYTEAPAQALQWDQTASCWSCHGNGAGDATPAYADGTPKANKHPKHVAANGFACSVCHWPTTQDATATGGTIANRANHLNRVYDVDDDNQGGTLDAFTYSAGSCSAANCHGGGSAAWTDAGPIACDVCHSRVNGSKTGVADANNFSFGDGVQSKVNDVPTSGEYATAGHGAKGKACTDCHDTGVDHDTSAGLTGANPFRLKDQDAGTGGVQFSCSYTGAGCHVPGTIGPRTNLDISTFTTHSSAAMTAAGYAPKYTWSFAPECVNCHDPHGDDANLSMIQRELYDKAQFALPGGPPPAEPTEQTALAFTDDTTGQSPAGTSYADSDAPFSSICQECHEGTPGVDTPFAFVDDTSASGGTHPGGTGNPGDCSGCHKHDSAFKPSGCSGCHGGGTTGASADNYWPDSSNARAENTAGRHPKHLEQLASHVYGETLAELLTDNTAQNPGLSSDQKQKELCSYCHNTPGADADHSTSLPAEVNSMFTIWSKAADDGVYDNAADTCANVDCHNNKLTTDGTFGWYDAGASTCTMCHTPGGHTGGFANPTTGLHDVVPAVSGVQHGDSFPYNGGANTADCTTCHTANPSTAHLNGTADLSAPTIQFAANVGFADGTPPTCAPSLTGCHLEQTVGESWSRKWHENAAATNGTECAGCHGDWTNGWNAGVTHRTDGGPRAHATGTNYECKDCHALESAGYTFASVTADWNQSAGETSNHGDAQITMNVNGTSFGRNGTGLSGCSACHAAYDGASAGSHSFVTTAWTLQGVSGDVPSVNCSSCHDDGGASGAPQVNAASPHTDADGAGATWAAGDCSACHTGHVGAAGGVDIPLPPTSWNNRTDGSGTTMNMQTQLGLTYSHGGIHLGGSATTGTTEAEICWNCHANVGVSEWGTNTDTNGTYPNYDFGSLNTSNWTTATWSSAESLFSYKTGPIQSTHSVNFTAGTADLSGGPYNYTETKDAVGNIRCSYCHDVHDLNRANGDGQSGPPHLRGSWMGSPYYEDGAPTGAYNYYSFTENFGAVPRGWHSNAAGMDNADLLGGWMIDQNMTNTGNGTYPPNWTLSASAGLCTLCHGTDVDNMDWKVGEGLWVGTNGHSNAVIGGTGSRKANIYSPSTRGEGTSYTQPKMGYQMNGSGGADGDRMYGLRNYQGNSQSTASSNMTTDNNRGVYPYAHSYSDNEVRYAYEAGRGSNFNSVWGVDQSTSTAQTKYHNFPCSKCHNPHASRLPKLMITNCLDGVHNTWDDNFKNDPDWTSGYARSNINWSTTNIFSASVQAAGKNKEFFYARSAQNCHRFVDADGDNVMDSGDEPGWNKVTPW